MKVNVALIGVGYWGSKLAKYIQENPHFNLKYMCNSKADLDKVWSDKDLNVVVVATPNKTHYEIVKAALLNNKNVLSEKPLALRTGECEELANLSKERKLVLFTEYTYTFSQALQKAVAWVKSGKIGKLLSAEFHVRHLGRFSGGSVYWLLGSHMLSILDMFVPLRKLQFKRKDLVIYQGEVETGIIAFNGAIHGQIIVSLNYPLKETRIILYGENGTIIYNPISKCLTPLQVTNYKRLQWTVSSKLPKKTETYTGCEAHNLRYAIEAFHDVLIGKKKSNLETAIEITNILELIQND